MPRSDATGEFRSSIVTFDGVQTENLLFSPRFGAVLEEFEVRDAMEAVLSEKDIPLMDTTFTLQHQQVSVMA